VEIRRGIGEGGSGESFLKRLCGRVPQSLGLFQVTRLGKFFYRGNFWGLKTFEILFTLGG